MLLLTGIPSASAARINPVSSELEVQVKAQAHDSLTPVVDIDGMSQGSTKKSLRATANAVSEYDADDEKIQANASVYASVEASWGEDTGILNMNEFGWCTENSDLVLLNADLYAGLNWQFVFTAVVDSMFNLDYEINLAGDDAYGLNRFIYSFEDSRGSVRDFFNIDGFGDFHQTLVANETYTVTIKNEATFLGPFDTFETELSGFFHWNVDAEMPVPEFASTFNLLSLGLLGLACLRNRFSGFPGV